MKEDLFPYYERELRFVREMAKEFARDHPGAAERLMIEGDRCADPHVERLIQAFALIAGRIRHKLDDEFPEITEALLGVLYPHYVRPIPSMAIAQFELDPTQGKASGARVIPRHSTVFTRPVIGTGDTCRFRTAFPVTLWPLRILSAQVVPPTALSAGMQTDDAVAAIRIIFECQPGMTPASMNLTTLRFHLHGENELPYILYELIVNNTCGVLLSSSTEDSDFSAVPFPDGAVRPVGFQRNEALLPYPERSFAGYQLLSDYFSFPEKFLFFDLAGFEKMPLENVGERFEVTLLLGEFERKERLRRLERMVRADNFQLGCTPVVNLFERPAEPIQVTHTETEYRVVPDQHNPLGTEVYSVDKVTSVASYLDQAREYQPFYGLRHNYEDDVPGQFWYASRRQSPKKNDPGTEVYLSLVDLGFRPAQAGTEALSVYITCTNRDLPAKLPLAQEFGELSVDAGANVRARCLTKPTESVRPPMRSGLQWRLISHLALNYLSLADSGAEALREILKLYNYTDNPTVRNQIAGIVKVSSRPHMTRMLTPVGVTFALGMRVEIEFDEDRFVGNGVFLMASLLERFLGLYSSINSFTQLTAATRQRKVPLHTWLPRAGEQILA